MKEHALQIEVIMHKLVIFIAFFVVACAGTPDPYSVDLTALDSDMIDKLPACDHYYARNSHVVAVTTFTNNTTYQDGEYKASSSQSGVIISSQQAGAFSSSGEIEKYITPQLGEYAQSTLETMLVNMGGPTVVSRSKIDAVLQEQQFQMTLADPSTIVDFGMLMGAQYIITGSVDNIALKYTASMSNFDSSSTLGAFLSLGSMIYNAAASGWDVSTRFTVNIIDVATGEIIGTHVSEGSASIGDASTLTLDQVVAGAKKAMSEDMGATLAFLNDQFEMRVYINELRGGKKIARLSAGSTQGLKPGDKFRLVNAVTQSDFLSNTQSCVLNPTDITLTVTEYMTADSAWAVIDTTNAKKLEQIKIGSFARRISIKR